MTHRMDARPSPLHSAQSAQRRQRPRWLGLCVVTVAACAGSPPGERPTPEPAEAGAGAKADEQPAAAPPSGEAPSAPPAAPQGDSPAAPLWPGCTYSAPIEPVEPTPDGRACRETRVALDGAVLERLERHVAQDGNRVVTREETFDSSGTLAVRVVTAVDARGDEVLRSVEHLTLAPDETLPYTYGQPATYAVSTTRDDAGRVVVRQTDLAMDGVVDDEERWTYEGDVVTRHEVHQNGELFMTETFRVDGEPLASLYAGGDGTMWHYDAAGLLLRVDRVSSGRVTESVRWTHLPNGSPASNAVWRSHQSGDAWGEALEAETTWTYDEAGRQRRSDGWAEVYGHVRTYRTEWDAEGRETRYLEVTEEPSCHEYERVATWAPGGNAVLDTLTTCDGRLFEHEWSAFNPHWQPVRTDRLFIGNPSWAVQELDLRDYDSCGAQVFWEHRYDGRLTLRQALTLDAAGRVVARTQESQFSPEVTTAYTYDAEGRLVASSGRTWTFEGERLARVDYGPEGQLMGKGEPPTGALLLTYDCP